MDYLQPIPKRFELGRMMPKSLQATRDGGFSSAIAGCVIPPACLSSLGGVRTSL